MENEKILKLVIKKAIDNDFLGLAGNPKIEINILEDFSNNKEPNKEILIISDWETRVDEGGNKFDCVPYCCGKKHYFSINDLLFNKEFAKCFWCEDIRYIKGDEYAKLDILNWDEHLQKLATEPDKIKYLEKFI